MAGKQLSTKTVVAIGIGARLCHFRTLRLHSNWDSEYTN